MSRLELAAAGAVALMLAAAGAIFLYAPTDALQGPVQRIFYFHAAAGLAAFGCFAVVLVGVVFTTVTLVMGMMWAKPIWGAYWTWDARLTSTLVLLMIYAGYLLVRRLAEPGRQAARFAAVVGIFGFIDVPITYFSVTWWRTQHPSSIVVSDALPPEMLATFLFTMACTLVLAAVMIAVRYRIETLTDLSQSAQEPARIISSREPEPAR